MELFLDLEILLGLDVVKHKHACTYKHKGDKKVYKLYSAFLGEHKLGEDNAEHRCHKAEDSNLGYGVELKKHAPKCVSDSGEECEVNENSRAGDIEAIYSAACENTADDHNSTAEHKLISADNNRILVLREYLDKNRGECERHSREKNKGIAQEVHAEVEAVKIYRDDAREADNASDNLLGGELLLLEDKAGDENSEEGGRAGDDGSLRARGVGKTNVEEEILYNGLESGNDSDLIKIFALRAKKLAASYTVKCDGDKSCSGKSDTREQDDGRYTYVSAVEYVLVSQLNEGSGTAPKSAAKHSSENNEQRVGKHLFNVKFLTHFYLTFKLIYRTVLA